MAKKVKTIEQSDKRSLENCGRRKRYVPTAELAQIQQRYNNGQKYTGTLQKKQGVFF